MMAEQPKTDNNIAYRWQDTGLSENPVLPLTLASQGIDKNLAKRAYRIIGVELRTMEKQVCNRGRGPGTELPEGTPLTLSDLGITKKQSFEWQAIADIDRCRSLP
jgi:hypothetical protein